MGLSPLLQKGAVIMAEVYTKDLGGQLDFVLFRNGRVVLPLDRTLEEVVVAVKVALSGLEGGEPIAGLQEIPRLVLR